MLKTNHYIQLPPAFNLTHSMKWLLSAIVIMFLLYLVWSLCCAGCGLFNFTIGQA